MFLKAPAGAFLLPFSCVSIINLHEFFQLKKLSWFIDYWLLFKEI
ncbi:Hypothetical protein ABZS17H1_02895 [Kosakonia cowanii]